MWEKVKNVKSTPQRDKKACCCVRVGSTRVPGKFSYSFLIPDAMYDGGRATFVRDGDRFGVYFTNDGDYKATKTHGYQWQITMPRAIGEKFPQGTTDLETHAEGTVLVFRAPGSQAVAAE